ncbi:hypothetical protein QWA_18257, partial [Alcaligenes faecalis subsp. faecalis NCIB 8687]
MRWACSGQIGRAGSGDGPRLGGDVMLVGRCEGLLIGALSLEETIARLQAFAAAGAVYMVGAVKRTPAL